MSDRLTHCSSSLSAMLSFLGRRTKGLLSVLAFTNVVAGTVYSAIETPETHTNYARAYMRSAVSGAQADPRFAQQLEGVQAPVRLLTEVSAHLTGAALGPGVAMTDGIRRAMNTSPS